MKKYRISPSLLVKWQKLTSGTAQITIDDFINYIECEKKDVSESMSRGLAYHLLLEKGVDGYRKKGEDGEVDVYEVYEKRYGRTWLFSEKAVKPAIEVYNSLCKNVVVSEMMVRWEGVLGGYDIVMNMRFDAVVGRQLHEFKTSTRTPDYLDYEGSVQWLCYMLGAKELLGVTYHIFTLNTQCTECTYYSFYITRPRDEYIESRVGRYVNEMLTWLEFYHPNVAKKLEQKDEET